MLTGSAANVTQLKTLAVAGVLNFRQVLLYQPYRGTTYGDVRLVNQNTLALFHKLVCTPDNTSTWKEPGWVHHRGRVRQPEHADRLV